MGSSSDNVARLKSAYRQWHESKGGSVKAWLDLMADDVRCYSLAADAPSAEFTAPITTDEFITEGDRVAVLGSPAWP